MDARCVTSSNVTSFAERIERSRSISCVCSRASSGLRRGPTASAPSWPRWTSASPRSSSRRRSTHRRAELRLPRAPARGRPRRCVRDLATRSVRLGRAAPLGAPARRCRQRPRARDDQFSRPTAPIILPTPAYMPFLIVPRLFGREISKCRCTTTPGTTRSTSTASTPRIARAATCSCSATRTTRSAASSIA